jgi:hypothetical protein
MEYVVLQAYSADDLQKKVNELLYEGYMPHGSLSVLYLPQAMQGENIVYTQPVVKEDA